MPLTVAKILALPDLHLQLVAGHTEVDRVIEAAHVSELVSPGEWLRGGELLMTIGLELPMDRRSCRAFVRDVVDGGASALALGLGHGQPYNEAPGPLVEAAEEAGLPLLTVPDEVPFIAVTKAVFAALAAEERQALERSIAIQRRLTVAAASGGALDAILAIWHNTMRLSAIVVDRLGRPLSTVGNDATKLLEAGRSMLDELAHLGLRGSSTTDVDGITVSVQPLGAHRVRGYAVLADSRERELRLVVPALVSLLTLELERRYLADEPERRRRAALLGRLLAGRLADQQARELFAVLGVDAGTVLGVAVQSVGNDARELAADLALALPGGLVRVSGDVVEALAVEDVDVTALLRLFAPGRPAGIGTAVRPGAAGITLRQARSLIPASVQLGRPAEPGEDNISDVLLQMGQPEVLAAFTDAALASIDAADAHGELSTTLRAWLDENGVADIAADRLGVHRHTVRNRLEKLERLTGRRLGDAATRYELWLAFKARDTLAQQPSALAEPPA